MKKVTGKNEAAVKMYNERASQICDLLGKIAKGLHEHARQGQAEGIHWGYVGDLGHVVDVLKEAGATFTGEEV